MTYLNFIEIPNPRNFFFFTKHCGRKIFLTGYSAAPDGYADATKAYVSALVDHYQRKGDQVMLITSPTASGQSIDAIGTTVAHEKNIGLIYITGKDYLGYVNPDELPPSVDKMRFALTPKYFFADSKDYSLASAVVADMLVVTGGRDTAVLDFMHALQEDKSIILLHNTAIPHGFDVVKNRPNNAAEYIIKMIQAVADREPLPYPAVRGFDKAFIKENMSKIYELVSVDGVEDMCFFNSSSVLLARHGNVTKNVRRPGVTL